MLGIDRKTLELHCRQSTVQTEDLRWNRAEESDVGISGCESYSVLVGVHTLWRRLHVIGHVGEAHSRVGRTLNRAPIRGRIGREDFRVLHRPADPHGVRVTWR